MPEIGIVGAGISGLHLALRLQQNGVASILYTERTPEEIAAGWLPNLVTRFDHTLARERSLGVAHWSGPDSEWTGATVHAAGEPSVEFTGRAERPGQSVDFRVYLPRLLADYANRGGVIEHAAPDVATVNRLAARHDLIVVASGRRSVTELFPRDPDRSPYTAPQRMICVGLYNGIAPLPEGLMHAQLCPGAGEILCLRFLHRDGATHGLYLEALPGGPLAHLAGLSYEDDRAEFLNALLSALGEHAPRLRERIDRREFDLLGPADLLQGAITPIVRAGWATLPDDKYAMAVGDAWIVNDPLAAQGANLGSHSAFVLADAIAAGSPYDEAFCRKAESAMWEFARPATEWSNAFLRPPPPHVVELLVTAGNDPRIADAYVSNFNDPVKQWEIFSSPEGAAAWLEGFAREDGDG